MIACATYTKKYLKFVICSILFKNVFEQPKNWLQRVITTWVMRATAWQPTPSHAQPKSCRLRWCRKRAFTKLKIFKSSITFSWRALIVECTLMSASYSSSLKIMHRQLLYPPSPTTHSLSTGVWPDKDWKLRDRRSSRMWMVHLSNNFRRSQ